MEHSTLSVSGDVRCEVCNLNVDEGDNFCRYCGHSLRRTDRTSLTVAPQNTVQHFWKLARSKFAEVSRLWRLALLLERWLEARLDDH